MNGVKKMVGWMVAVLALSLVVYGVRSCIRYEESKPKPPMIIVVEGVKYQDVSQTKTISVNNRMYFELYEQGEKK